MLVPVSSRGAPSRIAGLDGLRAFACLTVLVANFHHAMGMAVSGRFGPFDLAYFAESGIGVALLIVISGCVLSLPLWRRLDGGPALEWRRFALRRAVRLVPAYYACLIAFAIVSSDRDWLDYVLHALFVNNLRERSFYSISLQFWAIGLFVQFALLMPLIAMACERLHLSVRAGAIATASAALAAYAVHVLAMTTRRAWLGWPLTAWVQPDGVVLSHSTLAHLPLFLLGMSAGAIIHSQTARDTGRRGAVSQDVLFVIAMAALLALCSAPAADGLQLPYARYLFPFVPVAAALVVIGAACSRVAGRLLSVAPLRALGAVSYGFYVYQMACMLLVERLLLGRAGTPRQKVVFFVVSAAMTAAVSAASYLVMERPLLVRMPRSRRARDTEAAPALP